METAFFTILGAVLLFFVIDDIYLTILQARGRSGPVSELVYRTIWRAVRGVAFRLSRSRRHKLLNSIGPVLMPLLVGVSIVLVIIGYALIYFPGMPDKFNFAGEGTGSRFVDSVYFSGTTLTTVGFGDISPRAPEMKIVAIIEAVSGFGLISLAVTYLIVVYSALERKRAIALSLYHSAEGGADVVGFIRHHFVAGRLSGLSATLRTAARDLQEILESHVEHPIIHYFHPAQVYKGMPRVLFLSLEICAVIKSCLDQREYSDLNDHPAVLTMESTALHVLNELSTHLDLVSDGDESQETLPEEIIRWRTRFEQTLRRLDAVGIKTEPDIAKGWAIYQAERGEWEQQLSRFAYHLGYDWDEVTGDRDLEYAANEEMEEPRLDKSH
ncbi:MAG TPA: potassium channel family protein [Blastocatellia bacterium]|nr:potassium channel family protein [Blastocatellia bacterium]